MSTLMTAHKQWASRPADQRFKSLSDLHSNVVERYNASREGHIDLTQGAFTVLDGRTRLDGPNGTLTPTHWALGQLLTRMQVPRNLATLLNDSTTERVLNDRLPKALASNDLDVKQRVLATLDNPGAGTLRALHSDRYERLWDKQVTAMLMEYLPPGWTNPVAYAGGEWGAPLVPSGLYASDRDMFAFFVSGGGADTRGGFDVDGDVFHNGFFVWNSEVGAKSFGWTRFKMRYVCGNHMIWGAKDIGTMRARHVGGANNAMRGLRTFLETLNNDATDDAFVNAVRAAKATVVTDPSAKREDVLGQAYKRFKGVFTQGDVATALEQGAVEAEKEGRPVDGSAWFWLQGLTAVARSKSNADERIKLETDASELLLV
jgi:hypothetical protein